MELKHLKNFIAVADLQSFTKAANTLYLSQPTLSQNIQELEEELGVKLLIRNKKKSISLTSAGEHLLEGSKRLMMGLDDLMLSTKRVAEDKQALEELRVGFDGLSIRCEPLRHRITLAATRVLDMCDDLNRDIRIHYRLCESDSINNPLTNNDMDLVFAPSGHYNLGASIDSRPLMTEEYSLMFCSKERVPDTPESVMELLNTRIVHFHTSDLFKIVAGFQIFEALNARPRINFVGIPELVPMFIGIRHGVMLATQSEENLFSYPDLQIIHFGTPEAKIYFSAFWNKSNKSEMLFHFLNALEES